MNPHDQSDPTQYINKCYNPNMTQNKIPPDTQNRHWVLNKQVVGSFQPEKVFLPNHFQISTIPKLDFKTLISQHKCSGLVTFENFGQHKCPGLITFD